MLETLRLEDITVQLSVTSNSSEGEVEVRSSGSNAYYVPLNEFVHLRTEIHNLTCKDLHFLPASISDSNSNILAHHLPLLLDIRPTRETPLEHVLFQEPHSDIPLGILQTENEAREIGLCFLASGEYNFVASVRHAGFDASEVATMVRSEAAEVTVIVE